MNSVLSQFLVLEPEAPGCDAALDQACLGSDPGYHSASGSLSPASSVDSCCFSPPSLHWGLGGDKADPFMFGDVTTEEGPALPAQGSRRSRARHPGPKRQSASEREKLRMRALTKALHHLRTYLPPSLAPAGQTLTKIQTLRLTIHYISHLSAQLEPAEGVSTRDHPAELSPEPSGPQLNGQLMSCQSPGAMTTHQSAMFPPAFSQAMDQYSSQGQPYQNDFSVSHVMPDDYLSLQQPLVLSGHDLQ